MTRPLCSLRIYHLTRTRNQSELLNASCVPGPWAARPSTREQRMKSVLPTQNFPKKWAHVASNLPIQHAPPCFFEGHALDFLEDTSPGPPSVCPGQAGLSHTHEWIVTLGFARGHRQALATGVGVEMGGGVSKSGLDPTSDLQAWVCQRSAGVIGDTVEITSLDET